MKTKLHPKKGQLISTAFTACFSICLAGNALAATWGYTKHNGPDTWHNIAPMCEQGMNQSPIDISETIQSDLNPLEVRYQGKLTNFSNIGHTLQASFVGNNSVSVDRESFELLQMHLHTPSENLLNGKQYPLEAHFVHQNAEGALAVIAVFYTSGRKANEALERLIAIIPAAGEQIEMATSISPNDLLPKNKTFFRFNGSLTTPPCSEGVRWLVMKNQLAGSTAQIERLQKVMGNNNRPVQPRNARMVLH